VYNVPYYGYIEGCSADFGSFETGELVPHLRDVLDLMMEWPDRYVLLDIKNANPLDIMNFMRPVFDDYDYDFSEQVYIAPWNQNMLDRAAEQLPELPTSIIASSLPSVDTAVDSFNVNFNTVSSNEEWIRNAQAQGKGVYSWTINSEAQTLQALQLQIDGVLTDFIGQCETLRAANQ
jgi:glycerophosphoryl diester phosphodiesterase